ncbi:MAG: substrate-binding domain-containing protein [Nocardioides sp.]
MATSKWAGLAALAAVGAFALAGCGSSNSSSASGGGSSSASKGTVGVILPDTTTSPRWENNDRPSLDAAFKAAGVGSDIQNAGGDTAKFGTICDSMINEGVKVLMIVNLDPESGAACLKKATQAGITSIDYDRLTPGGGASYYVSFDNVKVGELMGKGLITCLTKEGKNKANIIYINGAETDNNAGLFKSGYEKALKAKLASGAYKLVGDVSGEWDANKAADAFDGLYTKNNGNIQGIVSANDTMAGGIIARLKANGLAGKVPITGQDASTGGLQQILAGNQCMTVYKNTDLEAGLASKLAIDLINGDTTAADALATGSVLDPVTKQNVKSALATPQAIFKSNINVPFQDGFAKASDVCTGPYAKLCKAAGVS